jgi:hypothetical protein
MEHPLLSSFTRPILQLKQFRFASFSSFFNSHTLLLLRNHTTRILEEEAKRQLEAQGMMNDEQLTNPDSPYFQKAGEYGLHVFDFYVCKSCMHPFFGGKHECAEVLL